MHIKESSITHNTREVVLYGHRPPPNSQTQKKTQPYILNTSRPHGIIRDIPPREREARKKRTGKRKKKEKSMEKRAPKSSRISKLVTIGNLKLDLLININLIKELVERARADT